MRIGGLASGIDTDQMVKQMMEAQSMKLNRVKQDKQEMEWKQVLYNELNKDFANFILDSQESFGYKNGRPGKNDWSAKTSSSNENIATITSQKNNIEGNHTINVENLAEGVTGGSHEEVGTEKFGKVMKFTINDIEIEVGPEDNIKDLVNKINEVSQDGKGTGVKATYDSANKRLFLQSTDIGEKNGGISITTTGSNSAKYLKDIDLRLSSDGKAAEEVEWESNIKKDFVGVDAKIIYNGIEMNQGSNDFQLGDMSINLKGTGKVTLGITKNQDAAVDKVMEFVENYNKMIDDVSELLGQKVNRDFRPLTEDQKKEMTEKEVELWEEKAKSGLMRNDQHVTSMLSKMRSGLYETVEGLSGSFDHITQIGISTQEYKSGAAGGKLQIDEDKLRKALTDDYDGVMELLFATPPPEDKNSQLSKSEIAKNKTDNTGLINRIFDTMTAGIKDIIHESGTGGENDLFRKVKSNILIDFTTTGGKFSGKGSISDIDSKIFGFDKKLSDLNRMLVQRENAYYAQFAAMEKALQQMNSQSGWLDQQM